MTVETEKKRNRVYILIRVNSELYNRFRKLTQRNMYKWIHDALVFSKEGISSPRIESSSISPDAFDPSIYETPQFKKKFPLDTRKLIPVLVSPEIGEFIEQEDGKRSQQLRAFIYGWVVTPEELKLVKEEEGEEKDE